MQISMNRVYLAMLFSSASVAGLCLIAHGLAARSRPHIGSGESEKLTPGFSRSPKQPFEFLDLDMGHEGLAHREKIGQSGAGAAGWSNECDKISNS